MANYYRQKKGRKKQTAAAQNNGRNAPEKIIVLEPKSVKEEIVLTKLINSMDLDEMLDASILITSGIHGEKIPAVESATAQQYAEIILQLNRKTATKPIAERMIQNLNTQIVITNKKTADAVEGKRLYRELMAEE